ncbi:TPA: YHYH domain-containing protein [Photobacterium damselae]|nr:YHYH domain-containing protein [Photobacterium damselae]MCG9778044.1 YHYH domain-containing protein [Photobacterium damselae]
MKNLVYIILSICIFSSSVQAHSGRTDSQGCHTDHKTGLRHCH